MKQFILVTNAALVTIWLVASAVAYFKGYAFDAVAALGLNIFIFGLPAFVMGYLGRWLPFGVALTSILLFLVFQLSSAVRFRVSRRARG
ncbi:MAG: hypothetical protein WBG10_15430 [Pseudolabrys sp.]